MEEPARLDNKYFDDIVNIPWDKETISTDRLHLWELPNDPEVMLNVDMALAWDIGTDEVRQPVGQQLASTVASSNLAATIY